MTRLSWSEIKTNAARFARDWKVAHYERGETQSFYNELFEVFGVKRRQVATFEEPVKKLGNRRGYMDLFWKGVLLVEQKSAGRDLALAKEQALDYFPGLKPYELPRYILLCDFQNFELYDLDEDIHVSFPLADLAKHVESFGFILGIQKRTFRDQDPVNIAASELMGRLHDALKASGYQGRDLERLLVRLLFCLFADDTGIFERGSFTTLIAEQTRDDGSDLGNKLTQLFDVLNEPESDRQGYLDAEIRAFPYINGDLFAERIRVPAFSADMRLRLLEACEFSWDAISPAIFGALFQSVMHPEERRAQGAHYTTERNILKVIEPLFLDELNTEFTRLASRRDTGRRAALEQFLEKLAGLRFFDPACGCGNFLIIAYRELRELELKILRVLNETGQRVTDIDLLIKLNVDQFYGIEIGEFPARIAEVALWMTDHIANVRASLELGQVFVRIPLRSSPHIHHADALEIDWTSVLPPDDCDYVFGNPPFIGSKIQTPEQRAQVQRVAALGGTGGTLDYVCAWFLKAGAYIQRSQGRIGFVATNSITQGEQVAQLWQPLFDRYSLELSFAHRTFAWGSDARGKAHVHVVIIGLTLRADEPAMKRLFTYPDLNGDPIESTHRKLSAYLTDASRLANPHVVVRETSRPINDAPPLIIGSKPIDDGHFIFDPQKKAAFLAAEPEAAQYLHPYVGSEEFINGGERWILALQDAAPSDLRRLGGVRARLEKVQQFRRASKSAPTRVLAETPTRYHVNVIPTRQFLVIPKVSSERREYVPMGFLTPPVIPSDLVYVLKDADLWHFAVLTSRMHMVWLRSTGGKLKSDFRYSAAIVYNTFPWPSANGAERDQISTLGQGILDARTQYPDSTLADLYDPLTMPPSLHKAHQALDAMVERLYRKVPFADDGDRVEHLLAMYERMVAPLIAQVVGKPKRKQSK